MEWIIGTLSGGVSGGFLGLILQLVKGWIDDKMQEGREERAIRMREEDRKDMRLEAELALQRLDSETEQANAIAAANLQLEQQKSFPASLKSPTGSLQQEKQTRGQRWAALLVDIAVKLQRPVVVYGSLLGVIFGAPVEHIAGMAIGWLFGERYSLKRKA